MIIIIIRHHHPPYRLSSLPTDLPTECHPIDCPPYRLPSLSTVLPTECLPYRLSSLRTVLFINRPFYQLSWTNSPFYQLSDLQTIFSINALPINRRFYNYPLPAVFSQLSSLPTILPTNSIPSYSHQPDLINQVSSIGLHQPVEN